MRENPTIVTRGALGASVTDDNVVALPNLASGRLADLLAAASGPAQDHELRCEPEARSAFQAVSESWPTPRRRLRRTPAVVAVTTMATMMVATTGLAAASELPGPAGRAIQGILGSVGVADTPTAPTVHGPSGDAAAGASGTAAQSASGTVAHAASGTVAHAASGAHHLSATHGVCATGGPSSGTTTGGIQTASCTISVGGHGAAVTAAPRTPARHTATPVVHVPSGGTHRGGMSGGGSTGGTNPGPIGGGTSRGGNQGTGGGTCDTGTGTTDPSTTTTTDPTGTTTTTGPSATGAGCGHHPRHGGSGSGSATGTGSNPTATTTP